MTDYIDFIDSNGSEWTRTSRFREAKETIAAQAAVIEKLRVALRSVCGWFAAVSSDNLLLDWQRDARSALAIPTDSTQILAEVRRAERERCAKVCESHPDPEYTAVHLECARRIFEME